MPKNCPGSDLNLPKGVDYETPVKRQRMQYMQTKHTRYSGIGTAEEDDEGPMPDTLRIGIRIRFFAMAPNDVCKNEWIAYTLYHLYDRLNNYWNLLMYFCFDPESPSRLKKAREVRYYGVPPAKELPAEVINQMKEKHCEFDFEWVPTPKDDNNTDYKYYPQYIEGLINHLGKLRTDRGIMPGIEEEFSSNFDCQVSSTYQNCIPFFVHVYRKHYKALCGMGILYHFNSFFMNIIHQGIAYGYITKDSLNDESVKRHYDNIYQEEEMRVKGGDD